MLQINASVAFLSAFTAVRSYALDACIVALLVFSKSAAVVPEREARRHAASGLEKGTWRARLRRVVLLSMPQLQRITLLRIICYAWSGAFSPPQFIF
jgi:hypothetical protein